MEVAKRITTNVSYLTLNKIKPVPKDSYHSILTEGTTYTPLLHHWVRLQHPRLYKGNISFITHVDEESLLIEVAVSPQLDFTENKNTSGHPPPKLLNKFEVEHLFGHDSIVSINGLILFSDERYCEPGIQLLCDLDTNSYIPAEAMPMVTELEMFKPSRDIPEEPLIKTGHRIMLESLQFGDQVKILAGEYQGLLGEVKAIDGLEVQVTIPTQGVTEGILMHYLQRNFQIGDEVEIVAGPNSRFVGWVAAIEPETKGDQNIFIVNTS